MPVSAQIMLFLAHTVPFYVWQNLCLFLKAVLHSGHTRMFILTQYWISVVRTVYKLSLLIYQAGVQFAGYLIIPQTTFVQTQQQNHNRVSLTFPKQLCGRISKIVTETTNYAAIYPTSFPGPSL